MHSNNEITMRNNGNNNKIPMNNNALHFFNILNISNMYIESLDNNNRKQYNKANVTIYFLLRSKNNFAIHEPVSIIHNAKI